MSLDTYVLGTVLGIGDASKADMFLLSCSTDIPATYFMEEEYSKPKKHWV